MKSRVIYPIMLCSFSILTGNGIIAQNFTKITAGPHVTDGRQSAGCAWGDYDNDGDEDLFVTNGVFVGQTNFLFRNEGPGNDYAFITVTEGNIATDNTPSRAATWGDYDNDGDLDLFVANQMGSNYNYLYRNNGDVTFTRVTEGPVAYDHVESESAGWFDYDRDGYLDIFVGNPVDTNDLYHNNGDGTFSCIRDGSLATDKGTGSFGWCDFDNDGDFDILVGYWKSSAGTLFLNNYNNHFSKVSTGMVLAYPNETLHAGNWVDYDNDGDWDIVDVNRGIYRNEGPDSNYYFMKISNNTITAGNNNWSISSWSDVDNDGDIDLFVTNSESKNFLYINNGNGIFTKTTDGIISNVSLTSNGSAWADFDNDGDRDVYVCNREQDNSFYQNENNNGNNWIKIKLKGTASNASAIGAVIKTKTTIDTVQVWQMRAVEGQSSLMGQNSLIAHFGLGKASIIDTLIVVWPAGHDTVLTNVAVNQLLTITEKLPEHYLRAEFEADTTLGLIDLDIHFTDKSLSDPGNPVTSWSWDFDGDGTEDSDAQNPEYTFKNSEGEHYNVSLVISNGINTDTICRSGFVRVLPYNGNLALLGRATASSEQDILHNPQKTIDDDAGTQWISKRTNSEWLKIELSAVYKVGKAVIKWVYGSGSEYSIQTSLNDTDWQTVFVENAGDGSTDTILLTQPVDSKFLKLQGADAGKSYKHSVIEFEVYQSDETGIENVLNLESDLRIYPSPSGELIIIDFGVDVIREAEINIVDMQGRLHCRDVCEPGPGKKTLNISELPDGMYIIRLCIGETVLTKKIVKY